MAGVWLKAVSGGPAMNMGMLVLRHSDGPPWFIRARPGVINVL